MCADYGRTYGGMCVAWMGGTPAVWNTCMVFFQAVLLAGYGYAHASSHWLGARKQAVLHLLVLRDGRRLDGTWSREGTDMYRFKDASGKPIKLKPGLTWIHVVPLDFDTGS